MTKYFKNEFAINGDKVEIPDEIQATGEVSYQTGFGIDYQRKLGTDILAKPFPRQGFNGLIGDLTGAIKQYQENGFFNFITPEMNDGQAFAYGMGACVRYDLSAAKDGSDIRIFSSKIKDNKTTPQTAPDNWLEFGKSNNAISYAFTTINQDMALTITQAGMILIDASGADITVTLPTTELNISYILKRIDNSNHKVNIKTSGTDKLKYNLAINPNGYNFFSLFGAGDSWQIVSDGQGNWFDIDREDKTKIGHISFISSMLAPTGGYLLADGAELSRVAYPFLWDFAQKSGALVDESGRDIMECYTKDRKSVV